VLATAWVGISITAARSRVTKDKAVITCVRISNTSMRAKVSLLDIYLSTVDCN